jgi:hypothetical protein
MDTSTTIALRHSATLVDASGTDYTIIAWAVIIIMIVCLWAWNRKDFK